MRVLARSRSDGLLSLWSLTNGNFHDSFETESKVKNFIDRPNVAGLAWLSALKFIETKQKGLAKHCWMIYKILYFQGLNNLSFNFKKWRTCSSRLDNFQYLNFRLHFPTKLQIWTKLKYGSYFSIINLTQIIQGSDKNWSKSKSVNYRSSPNSITLHKIGQ